MTDKLLDYLYDCYGYPWGRVPRLVWSTYVATYSTVIALIIVIVPAYALLRWHPLFDSGPDPLSVVIAAAAISPLMWACSFAETLWWRK